MVFRFSFLWGLLLGLATDMATQILTWLGLGLTQWFIIVTYILVVVFTVITSHKLKTIHFGKFTFKIALINVVVLVLIARFVFQLYMYLYTRHIDPTWGGQRG